MLFINPPFDYTFQLSRDGCAAAAVADRRGGLDDGQQPAIESHRNRRGPCDCPPRMALRKVWIKLLTPTGSGSEPDEEFNHRLGTQHDRCRLRCRVLVGRREETRPILLEAGSRGQQEGDISHEAREMSLPVRARDEGPTRPGCRRAPCTGVGRT
jgi:hypothetical protein